MQSEVIEYKRPGGAIQRVQVVRFDDWSQVEFLQPKADAGALDCFRDIYQNYLVPAAPWIFPNMILFQLPDDLEADFPMESKEYGRVEEPLTIASIALQKGVKIKKGKPVFANERMKEFWQKLEARDCVRIVCGKLPTTKVIPVGKLCGYLSEQDAAMKVNASFFIMDPIDCATIYDQVGTVFGLCMKDGFIKNPPLYHREALLVSVDGKVSIRELDIRELEIEVNGISYRDGKNAIIYTRPERAKTPQDNQKKVAIIGTRVAAVKDGGSMPIPASGFVMSLAKDAMVKPGDTVSYHGLEEVIFGIQVGNSIIKDGKKTGGFISRFYNIRRLERIPFPPSLYPMNYEESRAARIALGADKDGKPMLFWAEGAGKLGYRKGEDSTGASLTEMAEIAADLGMVNGVNLDGGGSAQILLNNQRALRISDRNKADNSDAERLIPLGLVVR